MGLDLAVLATGAAVLHGLGLIRGLRAGARLAGLAFVAGWAAVGVAVSLALVAGLAVTVWQVLLMCSAVAAAGLLLGQRIPPLPSTREPSAAGGRWIAFAAAGLLLFYAAAAFLRARFQGASHAWDAWGFRLPKAKWIVYFGAARPARRRGRGASGLSPRDRSLAARRAACAHVCVAGPLPPGGPRGAPPGRRGGRIPRPGGDLLDRRAPRGLVIETTAERTTASLALFSGSLLPRLLAEASRPEPTRPPR